MVQTTRVVESDSAELRLHNVHLNFRGIFFGPRLKASYIAIARDAGTVLHPYYEIDCEMRGGRRLVSMHERS